MYIKQIYFGCVVDIFISSHQLLSLTTAKNVVVLVKTSEISLALPLLRMEAQE